MLKELLSLAKEIRLEKEYRARLLKTDLTVAAFEHFLKKSQVTGVKVTIDFKQADGKSTSVTIEPADNNNEVKFETGREKFQKRYGGL